MLLSTTIIGWIGILLYIIIIFTYKMLAKNNEFAFIHILMATMNALWLPLPLSLYLLLNSEILIVGTIFGFVYLFMLVITMALQTGHITYIVKRNQNQSITEQQADYMMATLSNPFESLTGVFKGIWALF